jgi:hypothetical protein
MNEWVAHISLVFREMWDSTDLKLTVLERKDGPDSAVESHISRKTSEMWATRRWWSGHG